MSQQPDADRKPERSEDDKPKVPDNYEPPTITKIGSLRDVVGKSGPEIDFSTHNRARP